jgi:tetratricopeptide (TPR) repeat protein
VALRTGDGRLRVYEELGDCFVQKGEYSVAVKLLERALQLPVEDEMDRVGLYYFLGAASERLGRTDEARDAYERVLGLDVTFRDVAERLSRL